MTQIVTPAMIGWKPLTDISELSNNCHFPFVAYREKPYDFWNVVLKTSSTLYDKNKKEFIKYQDFKETWVEVFYYYPVQPMFWLDACTEREVALVCQVYSEIFNTPVKEN